MTRERGRSGEVSLFAGMEQPLIGRIPIRW
jgi:hypothetical protein